MERSGEEARQTERERENGWRVRGRVWVRKGCGLGHKLGHWLSINEGLEKG